MASKKILVAFGTRYGSAQVAARDIAAYLTDKGHDLEVVDLRKQKFTGELSDYSLVIAGSSVAMFSWVGKVKSFLKRCRKAGVPTAVYITCGTCIDNEQAARTKFLDKMIKSIGISPVLSQPIEPVIDFRPGEGIDQALKGRIKGTIKAIAGDKYMENGLMDFRDQERFNRFLDSLESFVS